MNDEIKEILWIIKSCKQDYDKQKDGMHTFDYGELYLLYNYITNLQRERDFYKHMCLKYGRKNYEQVYQEKEDYKSRCEKGIEYNNQIIKDTKDFYRPTTDIIYSGDCLIDIAKNNINILQNGSEEK